MFRRSGDCWSWWFVRLVSALVWVLIVVFPLRLNLGELGLIVGALGIDALWGVDGE